jgi:carotenoid cleavage dioxygenase-like enzyme
MAITAAHSILLDLNVAYDFSMLSRGHRMPLRWQDARKARIGIIPRRGGQMRWFEVTPCFIQHMVNAYDADASTIVLDAVRYPHFLRLADNGAAFEDNLEPRNRSIDCRFTLRRPKMAALEKSKVSRRHRPSARSTATNAPATSPEKIKSP